LNERPAPSSDEGALKIAQKWIKAKNRRRVTERALKSVESAGD